LKDSEEEENRPRDNGQHGGGKEDAPVEVVDGETHQGDGDRQSHDDRSNHIEKLSKPETLRSPSAPLLSLQIHVTYQHSFAKVCHRFLKVNQLLAHTKRRAKYSRCAEPDIEELHVQLV
jgi:hypothetical protein